MTVREFEERVRAKEKITIMFNDNILAYPCYFTGGMIADIDGVYNKAEGVFFSFDDTEYKHVNQRLKCNDFRDCKFNNWFHFCAGYYNDEIDCFEEISSSSVSGKMHRRG